MGEIYTDRAILNEEEPNQSPSTFISSPLDEIEPALLEGKVTHAIRKSVVTVASYPGKRFNPFSDVEAGVTNDRLAENVQDLNKLYYLVPKNKRLESLRSFKPCRLRAGFKYDTENEPLEDHEAATLEIECGKEYTKNEKKKISELQEQLKALQERRGVKAGSSETSMPPPSTSKVPSAAAKSPTKPGPSKPRKKSSEGSSHSIPQQEQRVTRGSATEAIRSQIQKTFEQETSPGKGPKKTAIKIRVKGTRRTNPQASEPDASVSTFSRTASEVEDPQPSTSSMSLSPSASVSGTKRKRQEEANPRRAGESSYYKQEDMQTYSNDPNQDVRKLKLPGLTQDGGKALGLAVDQIADYVVKAQFTAEPWPDFTNQLNGDTRSLQKAQKGTMTSSQAVHCKLSEGARRVTLQGVNQLSKDLKLLSESQMDRNEEIRDFMGNEERRKALQDVLLRKYGGDRKTFAANVVESTMTLRYQLGHSMTSIQAENRTDKQTVRKGEKAKGFLPNDFVHWLAGLGMLAYENEISPSGFLEKIRKYMENASAKARKAKYEGPGAESINTAEEGLSPDEETTDEDDGE